MVRRVERFALQSVARDILPDSRTAKCLRIRAHDKDVQVWKSKNHKTASYGGLQTCGSVWVCPVCGAKVVERRRGEIQQAMAMHRACGGEVHLLTLTVPHTRFDALEGLLERQGKALQGFLRDRKVKEVFKEMGYIGQIRGYETTHGRKGTNNGWHPHFHFLQFVMVKGDAAQLMDWKTRLYLRWDAYCQKAGLGSPSFQHGIDLRDGSFANNYVAKWGLEDEMTKGHIKKGKAGGETPFDLLRAVLADKEDKQAAALFAEFAKAFKGKRQLSWSNGLKAKFNLVEKNDEELAAELEDNAELLGLISPDEWRDVLKVKARATVLELAAAAGWPAVKKFLAFIDGCRDGVYEVRPGHGGRGSNADFGGDDVSNKKLRNVRFEVPQMSEEMGVPVVFETLEDAQQAAEEFGAYAIWKVRGLLCLPTGDIWSNESGQWLKVPKDFRCSEHANSKFA